MSIKAFTFGSFDRIASLFSLCRMSYTYTHIINMYVHIYFLELYKSHKIITVCSFKQIDIQLQY